MHWGELSVLKIKGGYPLHDLTASGINKSWGSVEPNQNRHGEVYREHHFGLIDIDWEASDPTITLQIKDLQGVTRVQKTIPHSTLTFPKPEKQSP